jgi:hypothetical protein
VLVEGQITPHQLPAPLAMATRSAGRQARPTKAGEETIPLRRAFRAALAIGIALAFVWATWPAEGQLNVASCSPDGLGARLSLAIHGDRFWRVQLAGVVNSRKFAENWDRNVEIQNAKMAEILGKSEATLNALYAKHPELAPPPPTQSEQVRHLADEMERAEIARAVSKKMQERVPVLQRCEAEIAGMLR